MFSQQIDILAVLPTVRQLLQTYQRPQEWLSGVEQETRHFIVRVPFVGAFSSGKSTLLNAVIGESLLSTNIDPQTSIPTELAYGSPERLTAHQADGTSRVLQRADLLEQQAGDAPLGAWLDLRLPCDALAKVPHLKLVDMPGWDSGNSQHGHAIDGYVSRSLAYCIVVSADEGSLHESVRAALSELQLHGMPVIAIISKSDKKTPDDVQDIARQVAAEIEKISGQAAMRVLTVSARRLELGDFGAALQELDRLAAPLFVQSVAKPFAAQLHPFAQYLDILVNGDNLDSEKIALERARIAEEIEQFETRLEEETRQLDASLPKVLDAILKHVQNNLKEQLDALTASALSGRDLRAQIDLAIRLGITAGVQAEFDTAMRRYFDRVGEFAPPDLGLDLRLPDSGTTPTDADSGINVAMMQAVANEAINIIAKKYPVAMVLKPLLLGLLELLHRVFANRGKAEVAEAERHEQLRRHLLNQVFPQIEHAARAALQTALHAHIQQARDGITAASQQQLALRQAALSKLDAQLAQGEAAFQAMRQQYIVDRDKVQAIIQAWNQA